MSILQRSCQSLRVRALIHSKYELDGVIKASKCVTVEVKSRFQTPSLQLRRRCINVVGVGGGGGLTLLCSE